MANRLDHLLSGPKPIPPQLQTEGRIIHSGLARLSPGLSIGDLVYLRSAGPCFIQSVAGNGSVEVKKQDGSRQFTMLHSEFRNQFREILEYVQPRSA